jgi:hypothetical protein
MPLSSQHEDYHETRGYSYPRAAVIGIDVHPVGENLTNTPHASHTQSAYGSRPYVSHEKHIWMDLTAPEKMGY